MNIFSKNTIMIESQNIEYKQSWHDDYLKWICGFASAQGDKIKTMVNMIAFSPIRK